MCFIENASIHIYADDVIMSLAINSTYYCVELWNDINDTNKMFLINHETIFRVIQLKDLGVVIHETMKFKSHIDFTVSKAKSRLAWIKRFSYDFDDP